MEQGKGVKPNKISYSEEIAEVKNRYVDTVKLNNKKQTFYVKRFVDIIGSVVGLIIASPIFLVIGLFMKLEDPRGPFFFAQKRIGKDGKIFKMYKIRSMTVDAELQLAKLLAHNEVSGAMFKMKNDPRVTRVGRFIRKTSMDELPQLWNVLKGDMSLVGPRPPLERELKDYTEYHKQRLLVKPGCAGLWQISGRNHVGFEDMVALDISYIENVSIRRDFMIIAKTVLVMIKPNGAY